MPDSGVSRVLRKEDQRFLTGRGHYTDDLNRPGQLHAVFVRSEMAHATVKSVSTDAAKQAPGVVAVFTGQDMADDGVGSLPCGWVVTDKHGEAHKAPPHFPLVRDKVRYVGDHVAVVIAETRAQAADAAELVEVDYEGLDANADPAKALEGAPQIHDEAPGNLCFDWELGDKAAVDEAFSKAHHVSRLELRNNRLIPNALEPRAAIGEYDPGTDEYTLYSTSQNPHLLRLILCAFVLNLPEHKVRIVAPDVGGGFGSKIYCYAEETVCTWASKKLNGKPVKWTAERSESFSSDAHGRDHVTHAELALDENGKFLALKVDTIANLGAYLSSFATAVPTYLYGTLLAGQYKTPAVHCNVRAVFTNTAPVDAYRGAGRPEATYVVERMVERAARDMNMDPAEIRRRNFVQPDEFPYQTPVALTYDSGQYEKALDEALAMIDYKNFGQRRQESERNGKLRGIGLSAYIEACGIAPSQVVGALGAGVGLWESAQVRFNATGSISVFTGSHSHGQGHETTFAQLVADRFGVPVENVDVVHGDTGRIPMGMGTYGSRSLAVGGSAIVRACDKVIEKGKKIAAHLLEASVDDIEFDSGNFRVAGTDKQKSIGEIAFTAYVPHNYPEGVEPGLDETAFYDPANFTYPAGVHIAEVEIDPETGTTRIADWVAVDDFGKVINPMIVEGQVHGGIAQGIGQALLEEGVYDEAGQLVTGSYQDYCMPRADDLPSYRVGMIETPCPHNPVGAKGCGEAGAIAAPPALMNAITDALGTEEISMPATREKVWRIARGRLAQAAE
ncbi:xanthine dehydrogenase family protein molybdopterin-binding subunit [Ferruginivarius sediminum]|uniref:Xanthine dehydrogenase family protein molybdopterin-binding subunit n=1 Tax=Ferruginivarius sediminum TaxID=2661937 RepID=A0A369TLS4_9PROT|nr:xanthine dehydrogenase family protein molybdopterin-binding subunit [Ferruginivarius sediminum]RDD63866.1 xanthine dehydrogenase family protein molybdopterin-binding subunit [Ferruginivarius sediminum]